MSLARPLMVLLSLGGAILASAGGRCVAQPSGIEVRLWPGMRDSAAQEIIENRLIDQNDAGLNRSISNVTEPAMTVYPSASGRAATVLILPGGGYRRIVIDKEGLDVARWFSVRGFAAAVLKYRTAPPGVTVRGAGADPRVQARIREDAAEALRILRERADEWGVDTASIGVIGFSAGGHLAASLCRGEPRLRAEGPRFLALVYPALAGEFTGDECGSFPPTFLVSAADDTVASPGDADALNACLRSRGISSELCSYKHGGHGFGLGIRGGDVAAWKEEFLRWLAAEKLVLHKN